MRFPGFTEEWKTKKLGDVMSFKVTNSFSREILNYEAGIVKNIHYGDIHTKFQTLFNITKEVVPFINEDINLVRIADENYCREGDIIFADASEDLNDVGKSIEILKLNNEKLLSGLHTLLARPKANYFQKGFNGYLFKSNTVRLKIQKEAQGSKVLSINAGRLSNIEITFPNILEQQKITIFLSLIDFRIQTQNKIIEQLETLIQNCCNQIFKQKIRFKDEDGNDFSEWREVKIGDILKIGNGKDYKHLPSGQVPVFGTGGFMTLVDDFLYDGETVCIGRKGTIDKPMYHEGPIWTVDTLFYTHSFQSCIPKFIFYLFQTINWLEYNEASGVPSLSKSTIEKIKIEIPSINEQKQITSFLSKIDKKIEAEKAILVQFEKQKKYLLHQMFV
ncbi:restriction endonuclease subunit S [Flavobacterium sp.]|uniref:restriction endonuclease subunit S n=1 Tax=Flavobacterium sp. TaxID=239 RepID=UPI0031DAEED7